MSVSLVSVLFVAAGLVAVGAFIVAWRRDLTHALAGVPLMLGGAGAAFAGVSRFAAASGGRSRPWLRWRWASGWPAGRALAEPARRSCRHRHQGVGCRHRLPRLHVRPV